MENDDAEGTMSWLWIAGCVGVLLLMLMVTVIYNDLTRIPLFEKLMPWR